MDCCSRSIPRLAASVALSVAASVSAPAQLSQDSWLLAQRGAGGSFSFPPTQGSLHATTGMTGQTPSMSTAIAVFSEHDAEFWYVDSGQGPFYLGPYGLRHVTLTGSAIAGEALLENLPGRPVDLTLCGPRLWVLLTTGSMLHFDPRVPGAGVVATTWNLSQTGPAKAICTDGRELFVAFGDQSGQVANVWAYDPVAAVQRPVGLTPLVGTGRELIGIDLDRGGQLRCIDEDGYIHRVPPHGGAVTTINPATPLPAISPLGYLPSSAAHNVWTGQTVVSGTQYGGFPTSPRPYAFLYGFEDATAAWTSLWVSSQYAHGDQVTAVAPVPFGFFGRECANGLGSGARMGFDGLPEPGGSFALTVRDAQPNGFAFAWLGFSNTHWPGVGPLPWEPAGAPGCEVLVSVDAVRMLLVDASGEAAATWSVPNLPVFSGLELFGQWAASAPGPALGLSSSDAVAIELR